MMTEITFRECLNPPSVYAFAHTAPSLFDPCSGGERQLGTCATDSVRRTRADRSHNSVALCRALVKNSHVLLLDEATSSVDPETDAIIQDCIRKEFSQTTLLCIAHRLATIVRRDIPIAEETTALICPSISFQAFYDKVLVMDAGEIAEFDHPLALFDKPDSIFRSMCDAAKLSREAILRIRAGENINTVEEEVQGLAESTTGDEKAQIPLSETTAVAAADKEAEAQDLIATVPTGDQDTTRVKE